MLAALVSPQPQCPRQTQRSRPGLSSRQREEAFVLLQEADETGQAHLQLQLVVCRHAADRQELRQLVAQPQQVLASIDAGGCCPIRESLHCQAERDHRLERQVPFIVLITLLPASPHGVHDGPQTAHYLQGWGTLLKKGMPGWQTTCWCLH